MKYWAIEKGLQLVIRGRFYSKKNFSPAWRALLDDPECCGSGFGWLLQSSLPSLTSIGVPQEGEETMVLTSSIRPSSMKAGPTDSISQPIPLSGHADITNA